MAEETAEEERAIEARSTPVSSGVNHETLMAHEVTLTILQSALADLSSGAEVFLRRDAGASGKLWFVSGLFWSGRLVSGESHVDRGGIQTLVGDELLSFVVESFGFKRILIVDVAPVVASCTALAESLVHAGLGLGSVLEYCTWRERTFGASHGGRSDDGGVEESDGTNGLGLYRRDHWMKE